MLLYRNILKQSWKITWRNKYLWFFGIFAALLGGGGECKILLRSLGEDNQGISPAFDQIAKTGVFSKQAFDNIKEMISQDSLSFFTTMAVLLAVIILIGFLVWLTIVSQVAIVNNTANIVKQKKHNFKEGMDKGIKKFWSVFALNIIANAIIFLIFAIISLPFIFAINKINIVATSLFYAILFIIFIPVAISLSFIIKYAIVYVVIQGSSLFKAIKLGWKLFMDNWLISFEMALILFFINFVGGLFILLIILILAIPFLSLGFIFSFLASVVGFWATAILAFLTALLLIVIGGAMLSVFQISSWTGLFIELVKNGGTAKIVRIFDTLQINKSNSGYHK
ncbi:MAG: hypothetical protein V1649_01060 [Patescibacteria group bacterium]